MTNSTPRVEFNINDQSINTIATIDVLPLDKQIYLSICQKGKGGPQYFNSYSLMEKEYGAETFNENNSTYFTRSAMFAKAVIAYNGIWMCRLIPNDAKKSSMVLYATTKLDDIPQYEKAADGSRELDMYGEWIPAMTGENPTVLPGIKVTWSLAPLTGLQTKTNIAVTTTSIPDDGTYIKYPIAVFESKSEGLFGDNCGFEFYYDSAKNSSDAVEKIKNIMFTMRPRQKEYNSSTVNFLRDDYGSIETSFTVLNDVINTSLNLNVGVNNTLTTRYTGIYELPFEVYTYEANYKTMMASLLTHLTDDEEESLGTLFTEPNTYVINALSGINPFTGFEYDKIFCENATLVKHVVNYLDDGTDGTITRASELSMVRNVLDFTSYPELEDEARYPITALIDPGYDLTTKYALIDFLDKRQDVCVIVGTYQPEEDELTEAEDLSVGQALYTRMLLTQESSLYGTEACRGAVVAQSGIPNTSIKNTIVPATFWIAQRLAEAYNKTYISSDLVKYPFSINTLFKELNWYPVRLDFKNKLWGGGINYCQYYDRSQLQYPAFRSVYPYETSKLIDFEFVYICCFIKQISREIGMQYTGSDEQKSLRHFKIQKSVSTAINKILNGKYPFEVTVGQSVDEEAAGYIDHVYIKISPEQAMTVLKVDLVVQNPNS